MYLGGGQVIQAPQTGEDVQINPVDLASVVVATRPADLATPVMTVSPQPRRNLHVQPAARRAAAPAFSAPP